MTRVALALVLAAALASGCVRPSDAPSPGSALAEPPPARYGSTAGTVGAVACIVLFPCAIIALGIAASSVRDAGPGLDFQ